MKNNESNNPLWIATVLLAAGLLIIFLLYYGTRQIQVSPPAGSEKPIENSAPPPTAPVQTSPPSAGSNR